jgi:hypothetical protein
MTNHLALIKTSDVTNIAGVSSRSKNRWCDAQVAILIRNTIYDCLHRSEIDADHHAALNAAAWMRRSLIETRLQSLTSGSASPRGCDSLARLRL